MLDDLQPVVRTTLMAILSALYESGMVEEVNISDVLRLFGVNPGDAPELPMVFSFADQGWIDAYIDFKEHIFQEELNQIESGDNANTEPEPESWDGTDLAPDRKLH